MRTRGAILREQPGKWEVVELELDEPRRNEITVQMVGSGLCHSELHIANGAFPVGHLPMCGGHEGAGVVIAVGRDTPGWKEGDHVAISCMPSCGKCRWCASGQANLCDLIANLMSGARFDDPTSYRLHLDGEDVGQWCSVSCFAEHTTITVDQAVKLPLDMPLEKACLLGCAVDTGWGSTVNLAKPEPGHTVIIMGVGGVGSFALQGAVHSGATNVIACDPVALKREVAESLGATHSCASIAEATELAQGLTNGQGADSTVITVGKLESHMVVDGLASIRKGGTTVVTGLGQHDDIGVPISMFDLTLYQKRLQGSMFGGTSAFRDIPRFVNMYIQGQLKLDEIITSTYTLDQVNEGYDDMEAGRNMRGIITFD
jgi:S-(hydroxymethyl)glutathione dehydrogenase/alcohol dehydrogenase